MKTIRIEGLKSLFLLFMILFFSSCDENSEPGPQNTAESAILFSFRTQTPDEMVYYMGVYPEIPAVPDVNDVVELGPNHRIYSYGKHPYTWDGNASTLTQWHVDSIDLRLSKGDVMSLAGLGISGSLGAPVFMSETKAYFFVLPEGKVVEFNPSEMTISQTHEVTPLNFAPRENGAWYDVWDKYVRGDKIIMPIGFWAGSNWEVPDGAQVAVFDISSNTVQYHQDDRLMAARSTAVVANNGDLYVQPVLDPPFAVHYAAISDPLPTMTLLKLQEDGSFDPNFSLDLGEITGAKVISFVPMIYDNQVVVTYRDASYEFPQDPGDRFGTIEGEVTRQINMDTKEVSEFNGLSDYNLWGYHSTIDGVQYFWGRTDPDGVQHSSLLKQNAIDDYTEVSKFIGGQIRHVAELW